MNMLKHQPIFSLLLLLMAIGLNGCDFIGDVLEFGFWTGIILVVIVVLIIIWIIRALRG